MDQYARLMPLLLIPGIDSAGGGLDTLRRLSGGDSPCATRKGIANGEKPGAFAAAHHPFSQCLRELTRQRQCVYGGQHCGCVSLCHRVEAGPELLRQSVRSQEVILDHLEQNT
jgi:hypothetical protein